MSGNACHTRSKLPGRLPLRAAILAALSAAPVLHAATVPPGTALDASEFLANSFTANRQVAARVARDAAGDFVIVWQSFGQASSTSGYNIYARRFNAAGQAQGSEFLVNTVISGPSSDPQTLPSVAMDAAGDFVVAWERRENSSAVYDVYARRYSSAGTARDANEFRVNSFTAGKVKNPAVAMDAVGDFVVAYESLDQTGGSSNYYDIYAQRYDSAGAAQGSEFLVNTAITGGEQRSATVAMDAAGDFVVAWENKTTPSGGNYDIYARQYDHTGSALQASEFQVNTYTSLDQQHPSVAMDAAGDFVVAWQSYGQANPGTSSNDIYARQYNAFGAAQQSSEFLVDTTISMHAISSDQSNPAVAMDAAGDFVVAWQHNTSHVGSVYDVFARQYTSAGSAMQASEFMLNTYTSGAQRAPAVAMDAAGDFVAAWDSYGQAASSSLDDIYARRYEGPETVDLLVALVNESSSVTVGNSFDIGLSVDNGAGFLSTGNSTIDSALSQSVTASGLTATFTLPAGLSMQQSGGGIDWTCGRQSGNTVTCTYSGSVLSGAAGNGMTMFFTPTTAGKLTFKVTVDTRQPQTSDNANGNTASLAVTVNAASGGGTSGGGGGGGGGGSFGLLSLAFLGLSVLRRFRTRL